MQQFHVWSDEWVEQGDWLEAVNELEREGKIRFFGVSINDHQPESVIRLVDSGRVDTIQLIYNIFDQSPEDELFAAVETANVGVIVRVPFDEGALTSGAGSGPRRLSPRMTSATGTSQAIASVRSGTGFRRSQPISPCLSIAWPRSRSDSVSAIRR